MSAPMTPGRRTLEELRSRLYRLLIRGWRRRCPHRLLIGGTGAVLIIVGIDLIGTGRVLWDVEFWTVAFHASGVALIITAIRPVVANRAAAAAIAAPTLVGRALDLVLAGDWSRLRCCGFTWILLAAYVVTTLAYWQPNHLEDGAP